MYVGRWGGPGNQPLEGASAVGPTLPKGASGEGGAGVVVGAADDGAVALGERAA